MQSVYVYVITPCKALKNRILMDIELKSEPSQN